MAANKKQDNLKINTSFENLLKIAATTPIKHSLKDIHGGKIVIRPGYPDDSIIDKMKKKIMQERETL